MEKSGGTLVWFLETKYGQIKPVLVGCDWNEEIINIMQLASKLFDKDHRSHISDF